LVIDTVSASAATGVAADAPAIDLRSLTLYAVPVDDDERAAHETVLAEIDKASQGQTVWRRVA
jgi:DNA polymerase-3 subunit epsilon